LAGQYAAASPALSLSISLVLAVLAKAVSVAFGVANSISIIDFVVISVVGGMLSSVVVLLVVVVVTAVSVRFDLDLDNVHTPIVTAAGAMVTLPGLFVATYLVGIAWFTPGVAIICVVAGVGWRPVVSSPGWWGSSSGCAPVCRSCGASCASRSRCSRSRAPST